MFQPPKFLLRAAAHLVLLSAISASGSVRADPIFDQGKHYHTPDLILDTVKALPKCLRYCLLGIELRMVVTPTSVHFYFVPRVEHYMAALQVMTSDRFPKEAYVEWAATVGEIQKQLLDQLAHIVPVALGETAIAESSGGRTRYSGYGFDQSTNFKEAEIMGHPVALLPYLVNGKGLLSADGLAGYGAGGTSTSSAGSANGGGLSGFGDFITNWVGWAKTCFTDPTGCPLAPAFPSELVTQLFDIGEVINDLMNAVALVIDFVKIAQTVHAIAADVGQDFGVGGGVRIDRLLCPNDVKIFYPYYLSGVDALFWRSGWPITDPDAVTTLFNPFSSDPIGSRGELWGHVYPRHGFLNNDHPGHVAPALAYRSAHLVADASVTLRPKMTTEYGRGDWQNLSPQPTDYCDANIANLPTSIDPEGGYAHNIWPKFQCALSEVGVLVGFIPFRFCFTF